VRIGNRPPVRPAQLAYTLFWVGFRGMLVAAVLTATLVAITRSPATIWVPVWLVLTVEVALFELRQELPGWWRWLRGRGPNLD
jgi:hypothetical protein